jgi:hypothetical protein
MVDVLFSVMAPPFSVWVFRIELARYLVTNGDGLCMTEEMDLDLVQEQVYHVVLLEAFYEEGHLTHQQINIILPSRRFPLFWPPASPV